MSGEILSRGIFGGGGIPGDTSEGKHADPHAGLPVSTCSGYDAVVNTKTHTHRHTLCGVARWRSGVAVARWSRSTKLTCVGPG